MLAVAQRVNGSAYRMLAVAPMDRAFCPILLRSGTPSSPALTLLHSIEPPFTVA
jgi:hypothetical protein